MLHINHLILILSSVYIGNTNVKFTFNVKTNVKAGSSSSGRSVSSLPIDTVFKLPSPLPAWPQGGDFATGVVDLSGLEVRQITSFQKIWATNEGGPDNLGVTCFEPSSVPDGFSMLGSYAQANNQPLFGWVLVGKTDARDQSGDVLKQPTDYSLVWSEGSAYFWLPIPPDGYKAVGHVITTSAEKPPVDKIRCVRSDFTDESETDRWIWGQGGGINMYGLKPKNRETNGQQVSVGAFVVQNNSALALSCLKSKNSNFSATPDLRQVEALLQTYSPYIYLHPKENYFPSSVNWYFINGALLYKQGDESNPVPIMPNGTNLPQGGSNDGTYWLDLPIDDQAKEKVKSGDLQSAEAYIHVKPILGATFTDIQVWLFYPFNGPATAKLGIIKRIGLGRIGEHVGDWEHVTLRISNFDGILYRVYFAEHDAGTWVDSCLLDFKQGNKFVGYSSRNGHACYYQTGDHSENDVGIINDADNSDMVMDTGARFSVVAADGLSATGVVEPPWLNYMRKWGPKIDYNLEREVKKIERFLPWILKKAFEKLVNSLPYEIYGEDGPTSPKTKNEWGGDEK